MTTSPTQQENEVAVLSRRYKWNTLMPNMDYEIKHFDTGGSILVCIAIEAFLDKSHEEV